MFQKLFIFITLWSLFIQCFQSLSINFNQPNDDSQLHTVIDAISNSNDESNRLYIYENITITTVHKINKNMTIV